jgi:hypothetical protein
MSKETDRRQRSRPPERRGVWHHIADAAAVLDPPRPDADRVTFGRLLEHGPAKHMFRPSAELSYYVRIETAHGERVFWSPQLKMAIGHSQTQLQIGDEIGVRENSIHPVTAIVRIRDAAGTVTEHRRDSPRLHWRIEKRTFFDERMLAAEALRNERIHPREAVLSYPELLPAYLILDSARKVAQRDIAAAEQRDRFVKFVRETIAHALERGESLPSIAVRVPANEPESRVQRTLSVDEGRRGIGRER